MQRKPIGEDPWQASPRTPGPLGVNDYAAPFSALPGQTPGPWGTNDRSRPGILSVGPDYLSPDEGSGGGSSSCPDVEIEVDHDLVAMKCLIPGGGDATSGRVRSKFKSSSVYTIVLINPDGKLRFTKDAETLRIEIKADQGWTEFEVSGTKGSAKLKDTLIEAHCDNASGKVVGKKSVTVFWFDAQLDIKAADKYFSLGDESFVVPSAAVRFKARATIKPTGVDCSAPQIVDLRVGLLQNTFPPDSSGPRIRKVVYGPPEITWLDTAAEGTSVKVPAQWHRTQAINQAANDSTPAAAPFYGLPKGTQPKAPIGCKDGGDTVSQDSPATPLRGAIVVRVTDGSGKAEEREKVKDDHNLPLELAPVISGRGKTLGTVRYPFKSVIHKEKFITWLAIFNVKTKDFCCLRQRGWTLDLDSDSSDASHSMAVVDPADAPATLAPITKGPFSNEMNDDPKNWSTGPIAGPTVELTKPTA